MPKYVGYFLVGTVFILGVSVGTYLGINNNNLNNNAVEEETNIVPVQDVVIRNVQEEKKEPLVIETVIEETKLSPYAKMIIEKRYTKCGHTTREEMDIPDELINMTESEIIEKYENWEIRSFSSNELSVYREINANCNDHFVLRNKEGFLAIYNEINDEKMNLKEVTDIDITSLPSGDIEDLNNGIYLYGEEALCTMLEDFES